MAPVPAAITIEGRTLKAVGRGRVPPAAEPHPGAMVYKAVDSEGNRHWTHEFAEDFLTRDKSKDVFAPAEIEDDLMRCQLLEWRMRCDYPQANIRLIDAAEGGREFRAMIAPLNVTNSGYRIARRFSSDPGETIGEFTDRCETWLVPWLRTNLGLLRQPQSTNNLEDWMAAKQGVAELPKLCYFFDELAAPGQYVKAIRHGETGRFETTYGELDLEKARRLVEHLNNRLGVSQNQATCMEVGSLFGWDVPGACPHYVAVVKLRQAKTMLMDVARELDGHFGDWRMTTPIGPWENTELTIGEIHFPVGVSGGGIVSVDGSPFDPDYFPNDTPQTVHRSIRRAIDRQTRIIRPAASRRPASTSPGLCS